MVFGVTIHKMFIVFDEENVEKNSERDGDGIYKIIVFFYDGINNRERCQNKKKK